MPVTDFSNEITPNRVTNPQADVAQAPATDLYRGPEGTSVRAGVTIVNDLNDFLWLERPDAEGVYTDYRITLRIEEDNQTAELAPQEASDTDIYQVEYIQLSKPTLHLIAEWTAERAGQPPENPNRDLGDTNAVYLKGSWNPGGFEIASDGYTYLFQTAGRYEYGFKRPCQAKYGMGVPPWAAELLGLGNRPFIYNTPNISGIFPVACGNEHVTPPTNLPGVPVGEVPFPATLITPGISLPGFQSSMLSWQQQNSTSNNGFGIPPGS